MLFLYPLICVFFGFFFNKEISRIKIIKQKENTIVNNKNKSFTFFFKACKQKFHVISTFEFIFVSYFNILKESWWFFNSSELFIASFNKILKNKFWMPMLVNRKSKESLYVWLTIVESFNNHFLILTRTFDNGHLVWSYICQITFLVSFYSSSHLAL